MFTNRDEANGIYYANKGLFAVDEEVQREAVKDFYEQRARVKILESGYKRQLRRFFFILGGEDQAKVCYVDFVLGSADTGDRLRCHLLDHRHQELPLQLPHGRGRRRGGEFSVVGSWPDRGAGGSLCSSLLVDIPQGLF